MMVRGVSYIVHKECKLVIGHTPYGKVFGTGRQCIREVCPYGHDSLLTVNDREIICFFAS